MADEVVKIVTMDDVEFVVDMGVAKQFKLIMVLTEDYGDSGQSSSKEKSCRLMNVTGSVMKDLIEWAEYHKCLPLRMTEHPEDIPEWDKQFVARWDRNGLISAIKATNYLKLQGLMDICCKTMANMIKGKTAEEMRDILGIENDFTPAEEKRMKKELPARRKMYKKLEQQRLKDLEKKRKEPPIEYS
ncbi:E3 ubiquitin ligase complex SCF subunit sconC [Halotydeus destructor]|nr:E3 ubiquitin ligase complex SCF subunit sconC [Halotydeus destructor]